MKGVKNGRTGLAGHGVYFVETGILQRESLNVSRSLCRGMQCMDMDSVEKIVCLKPF